MHLPTCAHLGGDMLYGEVGEAAQSNGLLDDGEGGTDHGLAGHTCCRSCKHKCELYTVTGSQSQCRVRQVCKLAKP